MATGEVSYAKARVLAPYLTPENAAALIAIAETTPAGRLGAAIAAWSQRNDDPDTITRRQHDARSTSWRTEPDGMIVVTHRFTPETGGAYCAAIDAQVTRTGAPAGASPHPSLAQRAAPTPQWCSSRRAAPACRPKSSSTSTTTATPCPTAPHCPTTPSPHCYPTRSSHCSNTTANDNPSTPAPADGSPPADNAASSTNASTNAPTPDATPAPSSNTTTSTPTTKAARRSSTTSNDCAAPTTEPRNSEVPRMLDLGADRAYCRTQLNGAEVVDPPSQELPHASGCSLAPRALRSSVAVVAPSPLCSIQADASRHHAGHA